MKISLLTDAPKHNLALMKISAWHKANGDEVFLNDQFRTADLTYASILYEWNKGLFPKADIVGGVGSGSDIVLSPEMENMRPDYSLYGLDFSLGYTFKPCYQSCGFCKVPKMCFADTNHHSIRGFHDEQFKKICLLNNNTFQDEGWKNTFEEIWDADLTVVDENGYDLRLLDDEKAAALKKTKFDGLIHFAWDRMQDEPLVIHGLEILKKFKLLSASSFYVLIGYDTTPEEDFHRCQVLVDYGVTPYPMPYKKTSYTANFKRFMNTFMWRKHKTLKEAWGMYGKTQPIKVHPSQGALL